ncbi:MAG: UDP-3-O-(3-hydroxymyristoyl)glucosamine N-acyltransferase [Candidatus Eremiobacteraeota bacterium]|nr:UDP-3-O-(3-hydroxymyristoyl)glucosamine N-acyltransferase [Candidatus Eremiobacteraeota bacterium]
MARAGRRLDALAAAAGGSVVGDGALLITRVAAVDEADPNALTFAVDERWLEKALRSKAGAVLAPEAAREKLDASKAYVIVDDVRRGLAAVLQLFAAPVPRGPFRHASAVIDPAARIGNDVWIGPAVVISANASIEEAAVLLGSTYIGAHVRIGARSIVHPGVTVLDDCIVGTDCVLQSGCVIGGDGFGFVRVGADQIKIPQVGNVVLGDRVEIGSCTTIDRAVTDSTSIGSGTKIDNQVQIAHNVHIGEDCTICAQVGIAGSTEIGAHVTIGGQAGITGHVHIGDGSVIYGSGKVIASLPPNSRVSGFYAQPHRADMEQKVLLRKLPKLFDQVRLLMNALSETRKSS